MMNTQISKENWKTVKTEILRAWDEISAEDIERTHRSIKSIYGLIQQKCALHEEEVKDRLTSILKKYQTDSSDRAS